VSWWSPDNIYLWSIYLIFWWRCLSPPKKKFQERSTSLRTYVWCARVQCFILHREKIKKILIKDGNHSRIIKERRK
jgi:hypothetical protein